MAKKIHFGTFFFSPEHKSYTLIILRKWKKWPFLALSRQHFWTSDFFSGESHQITFKTLWDGWQLYQNIVEVFWLLLTQIAIKCCETFLFFYIKILEIHWTRNWTMSLIHPWYIELGYWKKQTFFIYFCEWKMKNKIVLSQKSLDSLRPDPSWCVSQRSCDSKHY